MVVHLFTDGSCNNRASEEGRPGGWAFVVVNSNEDTIINQSYGNYYQENTKIICTSQRMEMIAVINGLWHFIYNDTAKDTIITVKSDSAMICNCINQKWYIRWWEEDFLGIKNRDLWERMLNCIYDREIGRMNFIKIRFEHVKGHSGNKWNELCDVLANKGRKEL